MRLRQKVYSIVILLAVIASMVACSPGKTVVMPSTERIINNDSTIILIKDSITERVVNDTLIIEKHHYHTIYKNKIDTLNVEIPVRVEVPKEITPEWCIWLLFANVVIAFLVILYVVFKVTKTIYLRR